MIHTRGNIFQDIPPDPLRTFLSAPFIAFSEAGRMRHAQDAPDAGIVRKDRQGCGAAAAAERRFPGKGPDSGSLSRYGAQSSQAEPFPRRKSGRARGRGPE